MTKLRWRIERDYQELKQEVGLGHLGHRNIQHTVRYTELAPQSFWTFWALRVTIFGELCRLIPP
jgi:SRSO17 transposase